MEKKNNNFRVLQVFALIITIIVTTLTTFLNSQSNKYDKIFWGILIVIGILVIIDDIIRNLNNKNKIVRIISEVIFFLNWILLSSIFIISLYSNFSDFTKMLSLIFLLAINITAYKKYMTRKIEDDE